MSWQNLKLIVGVALCLGLSGCGGQGGLIPATGKVTYKGQPVAGATLTFIHANGGTPAVGVTDDKGEFSVNTQGRPGLLVGEYKVGITKMSMSGDTKSLKPDDMMKMQATKTTPQAKSEIPAKYAAPTLSGLTVTVTKDKAANVFPFDLKD